MKRKTIINYLLNLFIVVFFWSVPIQAAQIDLSSLSDTSQVTHNHIWSEKHDEMKHWQECNICKTKQGESNHILSVSYTYSANSCAANNLKITSCSECGFLVSVPTNNPHTRKQIEQDYNKEAHIYWRCSVCGQYYNSSVDGYKYYYDAKKTQPIDPRTITIPCTVYDEFGYSGRLTFMYNQAVTSSDALFDTTYNIVNNTLSINVKYFVPEDVRQKYTARELKSWSYCLPYVWIGHLVNGKEQSQEGHKPQSFSYDASTGIMTYTVSVKLKDVTKDYTQVGWIHPFIIHYRTSNGGTVNQKYQAKNAILISTNFVNPEITSCSFVV